MTIEFYPHQIFYTQIEKAAKDAGMPIDVFCAQVIGKHLVDSGYRPDPLPGDKPE